MDEKTREEALKPLVEKKEMIDLLVDSVKEKLGDASVSVQEDLLQIQANAKEAVDIHTEKVESEYKLSKRNAELLEVNNNLFIRNSNNNKDIKENDVTMSNVDDEDALESYLDLATGGGK